MWGWIRDFPGGKGWNGCLTVPRVLSLAENNDLMQSAAPELQQLRRDVDAGSSVKFEREAL